MIHWLSAAGYPEMVRCLFAVDGICTDRCLYLANRPCVACRLCIVFRFYISPRLGMMCFRPAFLPVGYKSPVFSSERRPPPGYRLHRRRYRRWDIKFCLESP